MTRSTRGFYSIEAALIIPVIILAVMTMGYFIKVEGVWENTIHGAIDEIHNSALKGYDGLSTVAVRKRINDRIIDENDSLDMLDVTKVYEGTGTKEGVKAFRIRAEVNLAMPIGFSHEFKLDAAIRYRDFIGNRDYDGGLGRVGLETDSDTQPVIIFPQEGEKYHLEDCTYAKASVEKRVLTGQLKTEYSACGLCKSARLPIGSIVYCFKNQGTAYHAGTCRSVDRKTIEMDKNEAVKKGYTPCSKCGGS